MTQQPIRPFFTPQAAFATPLPHLVSSTIPTTHTSLKPRLPIPTRASRRTRPASHALPTPPYATQPSESPVPPEAPEAPHASSDATKPPLPASSEGALAAAALLSLAALAVPVGLSYTEAEHLHTTMLSLLTTKYSSHFLMLLYTALFGTLHSGLASLRPAAARAVGERAYRVFFALCSIPAATGLVAYFIAHRYDGAQLWTLQGHAAVHAGCYVLTFLSFLLLYPATFDLLSVAAVRKPSVRLFETGVMRISRHPQLWGQVLWCVAHSAWMGSSLTVVASLALVAHHCFGVWNGDRRLRDRFGEEWRVFAERTSVVPFAAVLDGRQRLVLGEFLQPAYLGVVVFVLATYAAHPAMMRAVGGLGL